MPNASRAEAYDGTRSGNTLEHFAAQRPEVTDDALEAVYFHVVRAEEPQPLGDGSAATEERTWTAEDWFELPAEKMFDPTIGDCQPRNADGGILRTAERLAVTAGAYANGEIPIGSWVWASADSTARTFRIDGPGPGNATLIAKVNENAETAAMRDLPGKEGYGRARGTEHVDRPSQSARVTALALHAKEIAEATGIEIVRQTPEKAAQTPGALPGDIQTPALATYRDGGVRATIDPRHFKQPATPDLVDEITAIAVSRAWQRQVHEARRTNTGAGGKHEQVERATVAGLIASHHLIQSAGVHTLTGKWGDKVTAWVDELKQSGPEHARDEIRRTVKLTRQLEWDLQLPRNPRQIERGKKRTAERGDEDPTPAPDRAENGRMTPRPAARVATRAAGQKNPNPPEAPAPARDYAAARDKTRNEPAPPR